MAKHDGGGYLDEIQGRLDGDVLRAMVETMVRAVLEEQTARHLGAARHERTAGRRGHRNGYKPRSLKTRVGELRFEVPQVRGVEPYSPLRFAKWQRSDRALLVACAEMHFLRLSPRKVGQVLQTMGGFELSARTVSCMAPELDERIAEFRQRRLDEQAWPYLMVDATCVKTRQQGRVVSHAVLMVACVNEDVRRKLLT